MHTIERARGLILRSRPFTETSLIINWLTPEFGRVSTIAKGARRAKSPLRGKLDLFYEADFSFQRSRRLGLHTLREVVLRDTNAAIRQELSYLQQASYCSALIEQTTELDTPLWTIFHLMRDFINALPVGPSSPQTIFAFEFRLLNELGLQPDLQTAKLTAGAKSIASVLQGKPWSAIIRLKLSEAQVTELRQFLHGFLIFHVGKIPTGRNSAISG